MQTKAVANQSKELVPGARRIVAGLSRFSYLRVITSGSTQRARYVMNGSLRQAGGRLRVAVQLVDTTSGAHLWAENYERPFTPEAVFELQDELVPRIVSTVADIHGVLPRSMTEVVRSRERNQVRDLEPHWIRKLGNVEYDRGQQDQPDECTTSTTPHPTGNPRAGEGRASPGCHHEGQHPMRISFHMLADFSASQLVQLRSASDVAADP